MVRQGGQLFPVLYNVYTHDLNHHLQATGVGCYVGGAWVNSLSYTDDMVLLARTVTALQTLLEIYVVHMLDLRTLYTTHRKQYVCWSGQNNHRVCSQQESGSEMRNLALSRNFVTYKHIMTADWKDDKDITKQFRRQNAVGNMLVRKFSFAPIEAKTQLFKSHCYPIYGCALWRHSIQSSIRKLTVSYSDTFKPLINAPRYTSSSLSFAMNATDHINVVFRKFAYSLMSRVIGSPNSIVTGIVNSDAYHQSPLMDKWESMLYV